jgi:hypothetical protein
MSMVLFLTKEQILDVGAILEMQLIDHVHRENSLMIMLFEGNGELSQLGKAILFGFQKWVLHRLGISIDI